MKTQKIRLAGVIGCPVAHSRSPKLHGGWLKRYDAEGHYVPLHVEPDDLELALTSLPKLGFVGANVTIPHKETVLGLADEISEVARKMGSANTLTFRSDGTIYADNTDGYGFIENLKAGAPAWRADAGPALVLGAGGASRAVIVSLLEAGVSEVILTNRTSARAEALAEEFGEKITVHPWADIEDVLSSVDLLVNTTSLGMNGQPPLEINLDALPTSAIVTDIVYSPLDTDLLKAARAKGCHTVDGLGMLLHQAVPGFERWFGIRPEVDDETRAMVLA